MVRVIKVVSGIIILLGLMHIWLAFPLHMNTETLWFVGSGMTIIIAGLLNFTALDRGGSKLTFAIAILVNALCCGLFIFALAIINEPQIYLGILEFLITTIAFVLLSIKK